MKPEIIFRIIMHYQITITFDKILIKFNLCFLYTLILCSLEKKCGTFFGLRLQSTKWQNFINHFSKYKIELVDLSNIDVKV